MTNLQLAQKALEGFLPAGAQVAAEVADGDTFFVKQGESAYFLKLCKEQEGRDYLPGECLFHTGEQLELEGKILKRLSALGCKTAMPLATPAGAYSLAVAPGLWATLCAVLPGESMDKSQADPKAMAFAAGVAAGRIHNASQQEVGKALAPGRPHREEPYVDAVLQRLSLGVTQYHSVAPEEFAVLQKGGKIIQACMGALRKNPERNMGLVHTDIRAANLLYDGADARPIDFTRCVYGFHLYDLGEMTAHMGGFVPDGSAREQILAGYVSVRDFTEFDAYCVDAFLVEFLLIVTAENVHLKDDPWFRETIGEKLVQKLIPDLLERKPPNLAL